MTNSDYNWHYFFLKKYVQKSLGCIVQSDLVRTEPFFERTVDPDVPLGTTWKWHVQKQLRLLLCE